MSSRRVVYWLRESIHPGIVNEEYTMSQATVMRVAYGPLFLVPLAYSRASTRQP